MTNDKEQMVGKAANDYLNIQREVEKTLDNSFRKNGDNIIGNEASYEVAKILSHAMSLYGNIGGISPNEIRSILMRQYDRSVDEYMSDYHSRNLDSRDFGNGDNIDEEILDKAHTRMKQAHVMVEGLKDNRYIDSHFQKYPEKATMDIYNYLANKYGRSLADTIFNRYDDNIKTFVNQYLVESLKRVQSEGIEAIGQLSMVTKRLEQVYEELPKISDSNDIPTISPNQLAFMDTKEIVAWFNSTTFANEDIKRQAIEKMHLSPSVLEALGYHDKPSAPIDTEIIKDDTDIINIDQDTKDDIDVIDVDQEEDREVDYVPPVESSSLSPKAPSIEATMDEKDALIAKLMAERDALQQENAQLKRASSADQELIANLSKENNQLKNDNAQLSDTLEERNQDYLNDTTDLRSALAALQEQLKSPNANIQDGNTPMTM